MTDDEHRSTSENSRVSGAGTRAEGVRAGPVSLALCALAAACLVAATALPVLEVSVRDQAVPALARSGWELHGPLFPLLAAVAIAGATLAVRGRLAGALGLAATGVATLAIVIAGDGPDIGSTGLISGSLAEGSASAGAGFYLAILAGVILLATGGLLALRHYEG